MARWHDGTMDQISNPVSRSFSQFKLPISKLRKPLHPSEPDILACHASNLIWTLITGIVVCFSCRLMYFLLLALPSSSFARLSSTLRYASHRDFTVTVVLTGPRGHGMTNIFSHACLMTSPIYFDCLAGKSSYTLQACPAGCETAPSLLSIDHSARSKFFAI